MCQVCLILANASLYLPTQPITCRLLPQSTKFTVTKLCLAITSKISIRSISVSKPKQFGVINKPKSKKNCLFVSYFRLGRSKTTPLTWVVTVLIITKSFLSRFGWLFRQNPNPFYTQLNGKVCLLPS